MTRAEHNRALLRHYYQEEREDFFDHVFHQPWGGGGLASKEEDALAAAAMYQHFRAGRMCILQVPSPGLTRGPHPDAYREANRAALQGLPHPLSSCVYDGGGAGADGQVWWSEPLRMVKSDATQRYVSVMVEPTSVELEIGSMPGHTAFKRMAQGGGMARWPYGADRLTICMMIPRTFYQQRVMAGMGKGNNGDS